jgi:hypothetical protein
LALKLKKTFTGITTIAILLILTGFAFNLMAPAKSVAAEWDLTVSGLVANPLSLNWTEIVAMPKTTVPAALICVDYPAKILMEGNWTGIKLKTLLEAAKPSPDVIKVAFYAADGYSTDLSIETANRDDVILAYEINGAALSDLRLVVPGKWGYKWISQVTVIELVNYNFLGKWESQGYSDEGNASPGGTTIRDLEALPKVSNPPPSQPTPAPSTAPSPSPSPTPFDQDTPTIESSEGLSIPTEAVYAIAVTVVVVVLVCGLTFVRKKAK